MPREGHVSVGTSFPKGSKFLALLDQIANEDISDEKGQRNAALRKALVERLVLFEEGWKVDDQSTLKFFIECSGDPEKIRLFWRIIDCDEEAFEIIQRALSESEQRKWYGNRVK